MDGSENLHYDMRSLSWSPDSRKIATVKVNEVEERRISAEELIEAQKSGKLEECFGTGTAAVISPVGELKWDDHVMTINNGEIGKISQKLYDSITGIQSGKIEDTMGWTVKV